MSDHGSCHQYPTLQGCDWAVRGCRPGDQPSVNVDVFSTIGCLLPRSFVNLVPRPLPLDPDVGQREEPCCRRGGGGLKLHRVPTPTRAHRLLAGPVDEEHRVMMCLHGDSRSEKPIQVKTGLTPDTFRTSEMLSHQDADMSVRPPGVAIDSEASRKLKLIHATGISANHTQHDVVDAAFAVAQGSMGSTGTSSNPGHLDGFQVPRHLQQSAALRHPSKYSRLTQVPRCTGGSTVEFDAKYWERRRKNNEAARRSRDIRRANERCVTLRAAMLERENARLRSEVGVLTEDTLRLYYLLVSRAFKCAQCRRQGDD